MTEPRELTSDTPEIMKYFSFAHLPFKLAEISKPFCELAWQMCDTLPPGDQKDFCLMQLLVSKDAAVRSVI